MDKESNSIMMHGVLGHSGNGAHGNVEHRYESVVHHSESHRELEIELEWTREHSKSAFEPDPVMDWETIDQQYQHARKSDKTFDGWYKKTEATLKKERDYSETKTKEALEFKRLEASSTKHVVTVSFENPKLDKLYNDMARDTTSYSHEDLTAYNQLLSGIKKDVGRFPELPRELYALGRMSFVEAAFRDIPEIKKLSDDISIRAALDQAIKSEIQQLKIVNNDGGRVFGGSVSGVVEKLRDALISWGKLRDSNNVPKEKDMIDALKKCRNQVYDLKVALQKLPKSIKVKLDLPGKGVTEVDAHIPLALSNAEAFKALQDALAIQLRCRAGEPSFFNMYDRASERARSGDLTSGIGKEAKEHLKGLSGFWSDKKNSMLTSLRHADSSNYKIIKDQFDKGLRPALETWDEKYKKFDGNEDLKTMRKSVNEAGYALDTYEAVLRNHRTANNGTEIDSALTLINSIRLVMMQQLGTCKAYLS